MEQSENDVEKMKRKRNTPVATLIRNYVNKKSGKVADSRSEIQFRFDYLDWKDQKKILLAFLESGKTDRFWAYTKLLDYWDKAFEPKVRELWEEYHEERSSWLAVRNFPLDYLSANIDRFDWERNYYFICLRLAVDKSFVIDRERLSPTDYLSVLSHTGRKEDFDASELLFGIVHSICVDGFPLYEMPLERYAKCSRGHVVTPLQFQNVSLAVYYLKELGEDAAVSAFEEWNEGVKKAIADSQEYRHLQESDLKDYSYRNEALRVARRYAYLALDDRYKLATDGDIETFLKSGDWFLPEVIAQPDAPAPANIDEMVEMNPVIGKLVGDFELKAEEPPSFF